MVVLIGRTPTAIDYLEFSAHRGQSILYFAVNDTSPQSHFFGFDTFTGLPKDWNNDYKCGHFHAGGRLAETADSRVTYVVACSGHAIEVSRDLSAAAAAPMPQPSVANANPIFVTAQSTLQWSGRLEP